MPLHCLADCRQPRIESLRRQILPNLSFSLFHTPPTLTKECLDVELSSLVSAALLSRSPATVVITPVSSAFQPCCRRPPPLLLTRGINYALQNSLLRLPPRLCSMLASTTTILSRLTWDTAMECVGDKLRKTTRSTCHSPDALSLIGLYLRSASALRPWSDRNPDSQRQQQLQYRFLSSVPRSPDGRSQRCRVRHGARFRKDGCRFAGLELQRSRSSS